MKKKCLFLMAMLIGVGTAIADNVTVDNLTVPIGGQATLTVNYQFDVAEQYSGWQFSLVLPEGLATVKDAKGNPSFSTGVCYDTSYTFTSSTDGATDDFVALSLQSSPMIGTSGVLISIPITCADNLTIGATFDATLKGIQLGNVDGVHTTFIDDVSFTITIGEPVDSRILLDENSTTALEISTDVNVRVKRTIKANEWSTICLPFSMTTAQVKETFGNDVQLGNFCDTESTYDEADNVTAISILFEDATEIEANHPYIIKVSSPVTEFTVDNVDVAPAEDDALVEVDNGLTGRRRVVYGGFYGTYHAETTLEEFSLFLNSNKFWYSTGMTKMKAFRAYFVMADVLTDVENAAARISFSFDNKPTGINSLNPSQKGEGSKYYNLNGQRTKALRKGLYIRDGKKIVVK